MTAVALGLALAASEVARATPRGAAGTAGAGDELVDVARIAPGVRVEMRYATEGSFLGRAVYPCARCLLGRRAAEALARAQVALAREGLGLKVWDCYRPPAVQREMWRLVPDARYVADPAKGSMHSRGAAVDLTLVDAEGRELEMPTVFDHLGPEAAAHAPASPVAAANRARLRGAMEAAGFRGIRTEWWHFSLAGRGGSPVLDAPLCE